jgi:hypothetical protein
VYPPLPGFPHHEPKAKAVIYLHLNGGPSQLDTWDYKPKLVEQFDKDLPESVRRGQRITTMTSGQARLPVAPVAVQVPAARAVRDVGQRAAPAHRPLVDDDRAGEDRSHERDQPRPGLHVRDDRQRDPRPLASGRGLPTGLGSGDNDLPAFVVFTQVPDGSTGRRIYSRMWGSGFMPTRYGGAPPAAAATGACTCRTRPAFRRADRRVMLEP